jgi:hypothetical protein
MQLGLQLTLISTRAAHEPAHNNCSDTLIKMLYTSPVKYVPPRLIFVHFLHPLFSFFMILLTQTD